MKCFPQKHINRTNGSNEVIKLFCEQINDETFRIFQFRLHEELHNFMKIDSLPKSVFLGFLFLDVRSTNITQ